jgi:dimethylhistidine N-methyltransferase
MQNSSSTSLSPFAKDVLAGLTAPNKFLSSKYFYNAQGDKLFQQIMAAPEYYLTDCEFEIFDQQKEAILQAIHSGKKFNLVELGAGDGYKTKILLRHFLDKGVDFDYYPIDISADVLKELKTDLEEAFPSLHVHPLNYEYFTALEKLNELDQSPKVILFLGSNLGNFKPEVAYNFYGKLNVVMRRGDYILSGIDLKKDPDIIVAAYNDAAGITRAFNLNLLKRINTELEADFHLDNFLHYPIYNPGTGEARSYLLSKVAQEVHIKALNTTIHFNAWEAIHMEISKKYGLHEIEQLAADTNFSWVHHFTDSKNWFVNSLWTKR